MAIHRITMGGSGIFLWSPFCCKLKVFFFFMKIKGCFYLGLQSTNDFIMCAINTEHCFLYPMYKYYKVLLVKQMCHKVSIYLHGM